MLILESKFNARSIEDLSKLGSIKSIWGLIKTK
jgi:hypothetical protein